MQSARSLAATLLMSLSLCLPSLASAQTIRLANGEWAPYMSEKLKEAGVMSHIVKEAFAREGIQVEYSFAPWKRAFEEAKEGNLDGSLIWSKTEEREADFLYSEPLADLQTVLFYAKDKSFDWTDTASLGSKKLGGVIGYSYGFEAEEKAGSIKIDRISTPEANYSKLLDGRIDAVLEDLDVGLDTLNTLGLSDKVAYHQKPTVQRPYYLILNKKNPANGAFLEAFNKGLKAMKDDGSYAKMLESSRSGGYLQ